MCTYIHVYIYMCMHIQEIAVDMAHFRDKVAEFDFRLASILNHAFHDCSGCEAAFKVCYIVLFMCKVHIQTIREFRCIIHRFMLCINNPWISLHEPQIRTSRFLDSHICSMQCARYKLHIHVQCILSSLHVTIVPSLVCAAAGASLWYLN